MPGCAWLPNVGMVALRKESVDRNVMQLTRNVERSESLSARRAWIEITMRMKLSTATGSLSARRAWIEIVSRTGKIPGGMSLSARRAWIEIYLACRI